MTSTEQALQHAPDAITGTYPGRIVPYTTRTHGGRFNKRSKAYHASQKRLAQAMRLQVGRRVFDGSCGLSVTVHVFGQRGDLSNYVKAVEDAAQFAGIISNDRHVVEQGPHRLFVVRDRRQERVEWALWEVEAQKVEATHG